MFAPEDLDRAGEMTAAAYAQVEAEMLLHLTRTMLEGDVAGQRSQTALLLLAQSARPRLRAILEEHAEEVDAAVRADVERALRASDEADLAVIRAGLGVELPALAATQVAATCAGVARILGRHNLDMEQAAADAFVRFSAEAVVGVNTGAVTADRAVHRAVRRLMADGIGVVSYRDPATGRPTATAHVDAAVRRHVRTQIAQAGAELTELRMDEAGVGFVEVTSHAGSRPSHQEWHGRVYSRHGDVTHRGVHYPDFRTACRWGDVADGIYGANCRHSHGPYVPGTPRAYHPDPEHPSGLSNDEVYGLTQEQRRRERGIRAAKRELAGAQELYGRDPSPANLAEANRARQVLRRRQASMRGFVDDANARCRPGAPVLQRSPRREWAGDMPKGALPKMSGRKMADTLSMPSVQARIRAAGTSTAAVRRELAAALGADGMDGNAWRFLPAETQRGYLAAAIKPKVLPSSREIGVGGEFGRSAATVPIANMETRLVPETVIEEKAVIAGAGTSTAFRKSARLADKIGGTQGEWSKSSGEGWAFDPADGRIRKAELHWAEEPTQGIREMRIKRWVDER